MEQILINDRYLLNNKIGHGGYASVFLALDKFYNKTVAIKILKCEANEENKTYVMFKQEAMTLAAISNNNIIKVYENGIYENNPYLVMEYVRGRSLKEIIYGSSYLLVDEVFLYMQQIINGLESVHNCNIIHRDLKPQNIIKKADGTLVILDFGTAFVADETINLYKEDGSTIIGTVQYMAPELVENPGGSIQTDIYALGVTMYEMFTSKFPFSCPDPNDKVGVVYKHRNEPFPSVRKINPKVPIEFENIIYKCCEKDVKKRYKNVNELRIDLINAYETYKNPCVKKEGLLSKLFKKKG